MTNIKAVDVSEIEKLPTVGYNGYLIKLDDLRALLDRSTSVSAPVAWKYRYTSEGQWMSSLSPTCEADLQWLKQTYPEFEIVPLFELSANQGSDKDE